MSKKIFVFDLDDTLISEKDYIKSGFAVVSKYISEKFSLSCSEVEEKIEKCFEINSKNVFNRVLDSFYIDYKDEDIKELIKIYRNHIPNINLYEDAKEVIEFLFKNDYKLGIITDGYKETQKNKLKVLNIEKYFQHIVVTDDLGREFWKPSEVPYKIIKEKFNCSYKDMVYIGDNVEKDFITAKKLGMETVQIERENGVYKKIQKSSEFLAEKKIKNLKELLKIYMG